MRTLRGLESIGVSRLLELHDVLDLHIYPKYEIPTVICGIGNQRKKCGDPSKCRDSMHPQSSCSTVSVKCHCLTDCKPGWVWDIQSVRCQRKRTGLCPHKDCTTRKWYHKKTGSDKQLSPCDNPDNDDQGVWCPLDEALDAHGLYKVGSSQYRRCTTCKVHPAEKETINCTSLNSRWKCPEGSWCMSISDPNEVCNLRWQPNKCACSRDCPKDWKYDMALKRCVEEKIEDESTVEAKQEDYRGNQRRTTFGRLCQRWDSQTPHPHEYDPKQMPEAELKSNYCRNPRGSREQIWCYTDNEEKEWEYCAPRDNPRTSCNYVNASWKCSDPSKCMSTDSPQEQCGFEVIRSKNICHCEGDCDTVKGWEWDEKHLRCEKIDSHEESEHFYIILLACLLALLAILFFAPAIYHFRWGNTDMKNSSFAKLGWDKARKRRGSGRLPKHGLNVRRADVAAFFDGLSLVGPTSGGHRVAMDGQKQQALNVCRSEVAALFTRQQLKEMESKGDQQARKEAREQGACGAPTASSKKKTTCRNEELHPHTQLCRTSTSEFTDSSLSIPVDHFPSRIPSDLPSALRSPYYSNGRFPVRQPSSQLSLDRITWLHHPSHGTTLPSGMRRSI